MPRPYEFKILVVDDEQVIREQIIEFLKTLDFEYVEASNGIVGFSKAKEIKPDAILLDIDMPRGDGLTMLKRLRDELYEMPIIMVTGNNTVEIVKEALSHGASDYLVKPVELIKLKEKLKKVLPVDF